MNSILAAILLCVTLPLSGFVSSAWAVPKNDILLVQSGFFPFDATTTVQQAFNGFSYFSRVTWQVYYDINNKKIVEARGYFDMDKIRTRIDSQTCVTRAGTLVGLTDTEPFLIIQFRPDFIKQRAQLIYSGIWGLYNDAKLDDTDLLWAKALVTNELPSPTPLCNMSLDQLSPLDQLAIQETPVQDPGAPADAKPMTQTPDGTPRVASDPKPVPTAAPKSAIEATKKRQEGVPTPTTTGR